MKILRSAAKVDKILHLFQKPGDAFPIESVCHYADVKNYNALKAMFSYIRKAPHIPEKNRIDVRISKGYAKRIK